MQLIAAARRRLPAASAGRLHSSIVDRCHAMQLRQLRQQCLHATSRSTGLGTPAASLTLLNHQHQQHRRAYTTQQQQRQLKPSVFSRSPALSILALLSLTALTWYGYQVYRSYGFPTECLQLLSDADSYIAASEATNDARQQQLQLQHAEQRLRQAIRYLEQRLAPKDRTNLEQFQRSATNNSKRARPQHDAAVDVPVVNKNYVHPTLLPHTMIRLAQVLQSAVLLQPEGNLQQQSSQLHEAEALYLRSIQVYSQQFGLYSPQVISPSRQLGWLYYEAGEYSKAEGVLVRVLELIQHLRTYHNDAGMIPDLQKKSTASAIRDYISLQRIVGTFSSSEHKQKPAAPDAATLRLQQQFDADVESEICEQLSRIHRATNDGEAARQWTMQALSLITKQVPPAIRQYYMEVADDETAPAGVTAAPINTEAEQHRYRRLIDLLGGLSSDLHFAGDHDLALRSSLAALSVLDLCCTSATHQQLPPVPSIDTVLPRMVITGNRTVSSADAGLSRMKLPNKTQPSAKHVQDDVLLRNSPAETTDFLDHVTLDVLLALEAGLDLSVEAVASLCNAATTLYSANQRAPAKHAIKLASQIATESGYSPAELQQMQLAAKSW